MRDPQQDDSFSADVTCWRCKKSVTVEFWWNRSEPETRPSGSCESCYAEIIWQRGMQALPLSG